MRTPQINERMNDRDLMRKAIELSIENIKNGGGPFGAVIAKDGEIIATGTNRVTADNDPTAHAEVNAIRKACQTLKTFDLSGCTIYTSCEPCPMCLAAIYWAHIDKIYYGNNKKDAADIGFDDSYIYDELDLPVEKRTKLMNELLPEEAIKAFQLWANTEDKTEY
jgi:tRNA(Arg) A34 adenosine deaminase TadA